MKKKVSIYLWAFIVPILVMLTSYIFLGVYPFGDKSILICDMSGQYVEFYGKFYDIFKSGNFIEIIYSWDAGMGDSFLTLMMYYLMSPLGYITLLFPKDYLPEALLFITLIKIGFCGLSFNYLLSFLFKNKNKNIIYTLMFSTLYALIGYNITYSFHIMWLDGIYLLPLVIVGVEKIISEKKWQLFCISILLCFVTNFYISYMIGMYSFLYFIIQILLNYRIQEYRPILQRFRLFMLATLLAVGIAAIFLVPTALKILSNNGGDNQIHYNLNFLLFLMGNLGSKFLIGSYTTIITSLPQLYCGIIVIPLLIVYFFNRRINRKEKIFYGSLAIFFMISFIDPTLNLLWHAGDIPNWFPSRFSFLFSFTILLMAYKGLVNIQDCKQGLNFIFGTSVILIIAQMIVILLVKRLVNGGVFVSTECFIVTLIFLVIYFFIFKGLLKSKKYSSYMIYPIILIELLVNSTLVFKGLENELGYVNRGEYSISSTVDLLNTILDDTTTFYRIDNQLERTNNESLRLGYSGVSYYSSMSNSALHKFLLNMGLNGFGIQVSTRGVSPFMDSLLDVRYRITSDGDIVENNILPLAFPVNSRILSYKSVLNQPAQNQNHLFELITNNNSDEEMLYSSVDFEIESTQNLFYEDNAYRKLNTTQPGYFTLLLDKNSKEDLFLHLENSKKINIIINNKILEYQKWDNAMYLSEYGANHICIEINEDVIDINDIKIYSLNKELLDKNIEILKKQSPSTIVVNNNKVLIKGKFQEDDVLFTSIPFEKGWKAKIDGKPIPIESLEEALILIDVPEGEHEIELYYLPQGLLLGGIISIIGIILFIMAIVYDYVSVYPSKKKQTDLFGNVD